MWVGRIRPTSMWKAKRGGLAPSQTVTMQRQLASEHAERESAGEASVSLPARAARALKKTMSKHMLRGRGEAVSSPAGMALRADAPRAEKSAIAEPALPGWMRPAKKVKVRKLKFRKVKAQLPLAQSARRRDGRAGDPHSDHGSADAGMVRIGGSIASERNVTASGWLSKMDRKGKVRTVPLPG